jgi:hypothetical protein
MDFGYDIFRTLDEGKKHVGQLVSSAPGEYFIRDASSCEIVLKSSAIPPA